MEEHLRSAASTTNTGGAPHQVAAQDVVANSGAVTADMHRWGADDRRERIGLYPDTPEVRQYLRHAN